ncbi:protein kinase type II-alpha regulatory subunit [Seminavis robusta]|uniref:Protein kinase type II-alpha regulatory subunit n=1 Tax=Seminavis robusta TaxID=568900 RepID=A0A9N8DMP4_9STRA|nr:protein kinase type II-alpha regulatory subunit [Seminavis robusta]|eukprot:Sro163_g073240.1 protein kinase type II-alpha regulatory subunit (587) ;mRNA; f:54322-56160
MSFRHPLRLLALLLLQQTTAFLLRPLPSERWIPSSNGLSNREKAKQPEPHLRPCLRARLLDDEGQEKGDSSDEENRNSIKTTEEKSFIREALSGNVLFKNLPDPSLSAFIDACEDFQVTKDQVIVYQGDSCYNDYVYLVADGECIVTVDGVMVPEPYGVVGPKSFFGDLGVLYNETRSATVTAQSETVSLWRVPAATYLTILNKPAQSLATMEEIDAVINQVSGTQALYGGEIIPPYKPERLWLWSQFQGTILNISLRTTLLNMLLCVVFVIYAEQVTGESTVPLIGKFFDNLQTHVIVPDKNLPFVQRLALIKEIWSYQRNLTTFVLTFFLNQAYQFWMDTYLLARQIQGRLNDFQLVLATNIEIDRNDDGTPCAEAVQLMDDIGQYARLYHILMWAGVADRFAMLNTPEGLERLESRGLMTPEQLKVLQSLDLPKDQLHNAPLEWMLIRVNRAIAAGVVQDNNAIRTQFISQASRLRGSHGDMTDKLAGRMPLAYTHLVQILVDTFVLVAPFALYADLGVYSVFAVGLVTLSYTGFLNLAKIFLDPLNNEEFCDNSIFMDLAVLIRESNGSSTRWKNAGLKLPF